MKNNFLIAFFFLIIIGSTYSQTDTTKNKIKIGIGLNPIFFIDYTSHYDIESFYPNWMTYGVDLNLNASKGRHTVELGLIAGNSYPVLHFINYYVGYDYRLNPKKWKFDLLANTKLMVMRYNDKSSKFVTTVWEDYSVLLGGTIQKTIKRFQFGISYYAWFGTHKFTQTDNSDLRIIYSYSKTGFVRTGLVELKLNILLTK